LIGQREHEIPREPGQVAAHRLIEPPGGNAIERGEVYVEHDALTAQ
jgi:hypothetical protein